MLIKANNMQRKLDICFSVVLVIPQKEILDEEIILKSFGFLFWFTHEGFKNILFLKQKKRKTKTQTSLRRSALPILEAVGHIQWGPHGCLY